MNFTADIEDCIRSKMAGFFSKAATFGQRTIALGLSTFSVYLLYLTFKGAYIMREKRLERVKLMELNAGQTSNNVVKVIACYL